jgi:hypothetical protein
MRFFSDVGIAILVSTLCGCVSMQQRVAQMRPAATQVAQKRGAFELACPAASAVVLSDEMLQTGAAGPLLRSPEPCNGSLRRVFLTQVFRRPIETALPMCPE